LALALYNSSHGLYKLVLPLEDTLLLIDNNSARRAYWKFIPRSLEARGHVKYLYFQDKSIQRRFLVLLYHKAKGSKLHLWLHDMCSNFALLYNLVESAILYALLNTPSSNYSKTCNRVVVPYFLYIKVITNKLDIAH